MRYNNLKKVWREAFHYGATQGNLGLPLPPNSPDLHQRNNKMKSWTDAVSSFPWLTSGIKTIKSWNNPGHISLPWNYARVLESYSYYAE